MLNIYNTLSRKKELFQPIEAPLVSMYVCGMTVYDYCHLGHARVFLVFDMIARWLKISGYELNYIQNITDIDDKIIARAAEQGEDITTFTQKYIDAMHEDWQALNIEKPNHQPRATEHIPGMIGLIQTLIDKGRAYHAKNGDVYFSVRSFSTYGKLSGKHLDDLQAGERVEIDIFKEDPLDFVLWKHAKEGEPSWPSPWGDGRPGWHIECSAMSKYHFGQHFDIHGGGADLQFPHHENEIAQSEGAHDHTFVNYWIHNGFVRINGEKMSKSLGNFFTIRDILQKFDAESMRFFILRTHYRSPINYSDEHLKDAYLSLSRLYRALEPFHDQLAYTPLDINWEELHAKTFKIAMDDDFNTSEAVAVLFELANQVNKTQDISLAHQLKNLAGILGLLHQKPRQFLQNSGYQTTSTIDSKVIEDLINERSQAKKQKDFPKADSIRHKLMTMGIILEDKAEETVWRIDPSQQNQN
jgi:cysteinyl-tRNA synthetase